MCLKKIFKCWIKRRAVFIVPLFISILLFSNFYCDVADDEFENLPGMQSTGISKIMRTNPDAASNPVEYACDFATLPGSGGILSQMRATPTVWARDPSLTRETPCDATGFMISPRILATAWHVWEAASSNVKKNKGPIWIRFRSYGYDCIDNPQEKNTYSDYDGSYIDSNLIACYLIDDSQGISDGDIALFRCDNLKSGIAPGDQFGYVNIMREDAEAAIDDIVYRMGQNPVYEDYPDGIPIAKKECSSNSDCTGNEVCADIGYGKHCYLDDTKYYGNILASWGNITSLSNGMVVDNTFIQRGFSGGPLALVLTNFIVSAPASTSSGSSSEIPSNMGLEGCTNQAYCRGAYTGCSSYRWDYAADFLGDSNNNNIPDTAESNDTGNIANRSVYYFNVFFDTWERFKWQANAYFGYRNVPFDKGGLIKLRNNRNTFRWALSRNDLDNMGKYAMRNKWRWSFWVYADKPVELCVKQEYTSKSGASESCISCNKLVAGKWQLAPVEVDLGNAESGKINTTKLGLKGNGNVWISKFSAVSDDTCTTIPLFNYYDQRLLWQDIATFPKFWQPASFVFDKGFIREPGPGTKVPQVGIVYGNGPGNHDTFVSDMLGLVPNRSYRMQFTYRTLESSSNSNPYVKIRRVQNKNIVVKSKILTKSSSWNSIIIDFNTSSHEDLCVVFGAKGKMKYAIKEFSLNSIN